MYRGTHRNGSWSLCGFFVFDETRSILSFATLPHRYSRGSLGTAAALPEPGIAGPHERAAELRAWIAELVYNLRRSTNSGEGAAQHRQTSPKLVD